MKMSSRALVIPSCLRIMSRQASSRNPWLEFWQVWLSIADNWPSSDWQQQTTSADTECVCPSSCHLTGRFYLLSGHSPVTLLSWHVGEIYLTTWLLLGSLASVFTRCILTQRNHVGRIPRLARTKSVVLTGAQRVCSGALNIGVCFKTGLHSHSTAG